MEQKIEFAVSKSGIRLDKYAASECTKLSRTYIKRLIEGGRVTVNDQIVRESHRLKVGDRIVVVVPEPTPSAPLPEDIPLDIVYEDDDILVVNKPAGLTVHPVPGQLEHTLVNAILHRCPNLAIGGSMRPGIVHRLDKDTSGLMVVAKNDVAHRELSNQMKARTVVKRYIVLVHGRLLPEQGLIEAPIARDPVDRKRMAVVARGRDSRTKYKVLKYLDDYTLLEVTLETGRTHQIRVHFSAIGYPVAGDKVYGRKSSIVGRQFVHACCLGFRLPSSSEYVEFEAKLPTDLKEALEHI